MGRTKKRVNILPILVIILVAASLPTLAGCLGDKSESAKAAKPERGKGSVTIDPPTRTPDSTDTPVSATESTVATDTAANQNKPQGQDAGPNSSGESTTTPQRKLSLGSRGEDVKLIQEKLTYLGYSPGATDGYFSDHTRHAVVAFQKVNELPRDGVVGPEMFQALKNPKHISPRYYGYHIEVSKDHQVLLVVWGDRIEKIINASTGGPGNPTPSVATPVNWKAGRLYVSRKYGGTMTWSSFFYEGIAVHGFSSVPPFPASHGCVRIPIPDAQYVYDNMPVGSMVYVY